MGRIENLHCYNDLPKKAKVIEFVLELQKYIFPGFFEFVSTSCHEYCQRKESELKESFNLYICTDKEKSEVFFSKVDEIVEKLKKDIDFTFSSDPACESGEEIIIAYPGLFAIFIYRVAHELYLLNIPIIPRIISEYAHSITGIDIHAGATIATPLFIDHGTGIVIGETTVIGEYVKIYHGVTLGALSLRAGQSLRGKKRHPTIGNRVTIYAGASILGGETVIGDDVTIGSNVFLVDSVKAKEKLMMNAVVKK